VVDASDRRQTIGALMEKQSRVIGCSAPCSCITV